ncbi:hypothetical protein D3C87_1699010 [compost metagenome]
MADISWLPAATLSAEEMASAITSRSFSTMRLSARPRVSLSERGSTCTVRSPLAIWSAMLAVLRRLAVMVLRASTRSLTSSAEVTVAVAERSPCATELARAIPEARLRLMLLVIMRTTPTATRVTRMLVPMISQLRKPNSSTPCWRRSPAATNW